MKKVLVIEDNDDNYYMLQFMLEGHGDQIVRAKDGIDGVKRARSEQPDLILMDIQLPLLNGYEATKQIKASQELSHIPIIAITSYAMLGDRDKAIEAGCDDYIEKPIEPETILSRIEQYL